MNYKFVPSVTDSAAGLFGHAASVCELFPVFVFQTVQRTCLATPHPSCVPASWPPGSWTCPQPWRPSRSCPGWRASPLPRPPWCASGRWTGSASSSSTSAAGRRRRTRGTSTRCCAPRSTASSCGWRSTTGSRETSSVYTRCWRWWSSASQAAAHRYTLSHTPPHHLPRPPACPPARPRRSQTFTTFANGKSRDFSQPKRRKINRVTEIVNRLYRPALKLRTIATGCLRETGPWRCLVRSVGESEGCVWAMCKRERLCVRASRLRDARCSLRTSRLPVLVPPPSTSSAAPTRSAPPRSTNTTATRPACTTTTPTATPR